MITGEKAVREGQDAHTRVLGISASPSVLVVSGAVCTSASAAFVKLSHTSAGTAAFLRCAIALVVLVPLAVAESRRVKECAWQQQWAACAAGALLGIDYVFWAASIHDVGAAIATVLINIQVLVFPLLARVVSGTALTRRFIFAVPVMLLGIALAGGVIGKTEPGTAPVLGVIFGTVAGLAYAGYLFLMRMGAGQGNAFISVCASTASASVTAAVMGGLWTGVDVAPGWSAIGWLTALALIGQVLAWLLIAAALPRLTPSAAASLLLLHPALAILLGFVIGERPTATQMCGCVLVIFVVWHTNRGPQPSPIRKQP